MSNDHQSGSQQQRSDRSNDYVDAEHCLPDHDLLNDQPIFPSPAPSVLLMILSIFLVESLIETGLSYFANYSLGTHILVDGTGTALLLFPIFYLLLYRPYKRLDAERQASQKEIQYLSRQLINTAEDERKALARDLHDDFGQILTALQFGVETIKVSCDFGLGVGDNGEAGRMACRSQGEKLSNLISELGDHVRAVSTGLRPTILDELGLVVTLKWLIEEFGEGRDDLEISFEDGGVNDRFSPEIELGLFRICQEALNNIAKHSQASRVEVRLSYIDSKLDLMVKDNGIGFSDEELRLAREGKRGKGRKGVGLLGMRERVAGLSGQLDISAKKGQGVEICAKIPTVLKRRKEDQ